MQASWHGGTAASAHPPPSEAGDRGGQIVMVGEGRSGCVDRQVPNYYVHFWRGGWYAALGRWVEGP